MILDVPLLRTLKSGMSAHTVGKRKGPGFTGAFGVGEET